MPLGTFFGKVTEALPTGQLVPIAIACVEIDFGLGTVSMHVLQTGEYLVDVMPGQGYKGTFSAPGYVTVVRNGLAVGEQQFIKLDVTLERKQLGSPPRTDAFKASLAEPKLPRPQVRIQPNLEAEARSLRERYRSLLGRVRFCRFCGAPNPPSAFVCQKCGK